MAATVVLKAREAVFHSLRCASSGTDGVLVVALRRVGARICEAGIVLGL